MAEDAPDQDQKTEDPTLKRLIEARSQGKLPISREVSAWITLLGILIVIAWLGPVMIRDLISILKNFLQSPHTMTLTDKSLQAIVMDSLMQVGMATGLIFLLMVAVIILGIMAQTGPFASFDLIKPDFTRLNPVNGLKKLASIHSVVDLVKSFGKLVVLGTATYYTLLPLVDDMVGLTGWSFISSIAYLHQQAVHLIITLLLLFTVIALGDWFFQRYSYTKGLKMTKEEVKDEHRQQEGDPMIKARLRQIRVEKARKRMMAQVPKADVIITNPTHYAIALKYDNSKMGAPVVLAKGIDRIAERIREVADEHRIPLVSNPPLARALYDTVEIDAEIPAQHYRAVAEVISYIYKLKNRKI